MKRPGLLRQTCSGLGLALLMAFGLVAVAIRAFRPVHRRHRGRWN